MSRWQVCIGGYPNGWEPPILETDDHEEAIRFYDNLGPLGRMTTAAIFDDKVGEGEPLCSETVADRVADEEYVRAGGR